MIPECAALDVGADGARVGVAGPDGRPEPVAVLGPGTGAAAALDALVGAPVPVAVVHRSGEAPPTAAGWSLRAVPAPVAVLAGRQCRGPRLVVDAGRTRTTLAVVDGDRVLAGETVAVGGDVLDGVVAELVGPGAARAAREALSCAERVDVPGAGRLDAARVEAALAASLEPVADRAAALASRHDAVDVVLVGGVARTPLLAALLDDRVRRPVRVPRSPERAAVTGALRWFRAHPAAPPPAAPSPVGSPLPGAPPVDLPPADLPGRERRARRAAGAPIAAVALGVLLLGSGTALGAARGAPPTGPAAESPTAPTTEPTTAPATERGDVLVQYGYSTALPAGWEHAGGDPARRRTLLARADAPGGVELVSVERSPLGYDSATEPGRAAAELAAAFAGADAVAGVADLRADTVAGRPVSRYVQRAGAGAVVDWYVLFDGTDELAVGCRRPADRPAPALAAACAEVVGSVRAVP